MTQGTSLLEQSSLSFHCNVCCFISRSEVVSFWYNRSESLKFNVCVPDHKICIYLENVIFPQFF